MPRYNEEARITLNGDRALAARYVSEGRKYLGGLMVTNAVETAVRELTNPDGVHFRVGYFGGVPFIEITAGGGGEKYAAGTVQGYLLSQRTFASPQGYSTTPHVLLEPAGGIGATWKSYFCYPDGTHPAPTYPYDAKALNNILSVLNVNALASNAAPERGQLSLAYWKNSKDDLFLQYAGFVGATNMPDSGEVYHNGKMIFEIERDYPGVGLYFVGIAAAGAKRTATGLTCVLATYAASGYSGPCYLKVHTLKLVPTAAEAGRLAGFAGTVDNHLGYAAEYELSGAPTEIYSVALSKSTYYVWFCMSVNASCTEIRGMIAEDPGGFESINEYVVDISDLGSVSHSVVRSTSPVYGDWMDAYTGHIGDCPVYGEMFLADPGAQYRFREYAPNPTPSGALDAYLRTGTIWMTSTDRQFEWNAVNNIGDMCAMKQFNLSGVFSAVYADGVKIYDGGA